MTCDIEDDDRAWPHAVLARARGLIATSDEDMEAAFAAALRWHERTPTPFEQARTQLCLETCRRRSGRRRDAREPLRAALATFAHLGAVPWVHKATRELTATGERTPGRTAPATSTLTAQELQVAMVVGQGLSNRDAASVLFLSPKTIEAHLSRVFAKLQVRSRAQLARLMAEREAPTG